MMIKIIRRLAMMLIFTGVIGMPINGYTHHSVFAEFDIEGSITIEGVITEFWFKNPHVSIYVDVPNENGNLVPWNTHGHNPTTLRRGGWTNDTFKVGDKIIMSGDPSFDGSPKMFMRTIILEDGTVWNNSVSGAG